MFFPITILVGISAGYYGKWWLWLISGFVAGVGSPIQHEFSDDPRMGCGYFVIFLVGFGVVAYEIKSFAPFWAVFGLVLIAFGWLISSDH